MNKDQMSQATRSYKTHSILINAIENTIYMSFYFIVSLLTVERIYFHRITLTLETRLMKPYLV